MSRFSDLRDKLKKATDFTGEDLIESEYEEEENEPEEDSYTFNSGNNYNYDFSSNSSDSYSNDFYSKSANSSKRVTSEGGNIYRMDSNVSKAQHSKIDRVLFFVLEDAEDARNIADCMKKDDCVILSDLSKISPADRDRVLNFLDGVRYVCKSQLESINGLLLIAPESIQMSGDFYDQVGFGSFSGN